METFKKIHFVGIGGIGMSALARHFLAEGKEVSGSDQTVSNITCGIEALGIPFTKNQKAENITEDIDLVIYTEAMPKDAPELLKAQSLGIKTLNYFDALGLIANEYFLIAVAGTHGKSTTTAMLIDIFESAGLDPSAIVGTLRAKTQSNYRRGKSKYFIVEACEYKKDFLSLTPDVLVITNIEHDHVDCYDSLESVQDSFKEFIGRVREGGTVIANMGDKNVSACLAGNEITVVDYGKYFNPILKLPLPGIHNQMNAAAAIAASSNEGIAVHDAEETLTNFAGVWRRFEYKGEIHGAKIYDDYAHHPTEITAAIKGAREWYPDKKIIVAFQSHTYSRTHTLFDGFVDSLALADMVYVLPIYAAREENISGVSHTKLADAIQEKGVDAEATESFKETEEKLRASADNDTVIITMGAGENNQIADALTK